MPVSKSPKRKKSRVSGITRQAQRFRSLREKGLCQVCMEPHSKDSTSLCDKHLVEMRLRMRLRVAQRRALKAGPAKRVSAEKRQEVITLLKAGESVRSVKTKTGVDTGSIDRILLAMK